MKLKIMTTKALEYVKNNLISLLPHYLNQENPEIWIRDAIGESGFVTIDVLGELPDFELAIDSNNPSSTDVQNIKTFYGNLMVLNDSFASDERLWAGLSHTIFYDYIQSRWSLIGKKKDVQCNDILNHYFFNHGKQRSYMTNTLARLWWFGRKLYMSNSDNPFYALDYIANDINGYGFTMFGSNWSNNTNTLKTFFDAIMMFDNKHGIKVKRELFNEVLQYTNCLGGIYIIDTCDEDFLIEKIYKFLEHSSGVLVP